MQYPKTSAKCGRSNQVFTAELNIDPLDQKDYDGGTPPLEMFKKWSGLKLNFSVSDGDVKKGGDGQIEVKKLNDVKMRTQIAMQAVMEAESKRLAFGGSNAVSDNKPNILDTKLLFTPRNYEKYRGQSVISFATQEPSDVVFTHIHTLREQEKKNAKFAQSNKNQADALEVAYTITLAKKTMVAPGKSLANIFSGDEASVYQFCSHLDPRDPNRELAQRCYDIIQKYPSVKNAMSSDATVTDASRKAYIIYPKVLKTPRPDKLDNEGMTEAYSLSVMCYPDDEYPFEVELQTMKGRPLSGRSVGIDGKTVKDRKSFSIKLASWEWTNLIEKTCYEKDLVEMFSFLSAYKSVKIYDEENRNAWKQQKYVQ